MQSIVSKLIINEEIRGAWDQPTNTIVMQNVESSHLQTAAIQFADKVNLLLEINERCLRSLRTGGIHDDEEGRRKGHWDDDGPGGVRKNYSNRTPPLPLILFGGLFRCLCSLLGARSGHVRGGAHVRGRGRGRGEGSGGFHSLPRNQGGGKNQPGASMA